MKLISSRREQVGTDRVRLVGAVSYDDRPGFVEEYWIEFPLELQATLTESGNPWLVVLAPLAAKLGQPLRVEGRVDALLLRNVSELMAIWKSWYPRLDVVPVEAAVVSPVADRPGERTALFFSLGVDSFFSLFHNERRDPGSFPTDDLIAVHGFDLRLDKAQEFARHLQRVRRVAELTGKTLVAAATNFRDTRFGELSWGDLGHGVAIGAVGLALEPRYRRLLIASTNPYDALGPVGSHPMTDPLLSTLGTRALHDGAAFHRWEKLELLSRFDVVRQTLHVCFRSGTEDNCGQCEKCLRNMIVLELLGALERFEVFPVRKLDLRKVSRLVQARSWQPTFYGQLRQFAISRGRPDVARAIGRSFRRSRVRRPLLGLVDRLGEHRGLWRLRRPLERLVYGESVR